MTNTLHRYGDAESFVDDYIVFASPSRGKNDEGSIPKLKKFLEMALPFKPVNIGDPAHGGALRPSKNETVLSHWHRDVRPRLRAVIDGIDEPASVAAVFDNLEAAENFLKTVKEADLGLSVNISASIEGARKCCTFAGIEPHSIGYSLGFEGKIEVQSKPTLTDAQAVLTLVSPYEFPTLRIPVLAGRVYDDAEVMRAAHLALVNQAFVKQYLGGGDPIGQRIRSPMLRVEQPSLLLAQAPDDWMEVIGVVGDARNNGPSSVKERSNVVIVSFPSNAGGSFVF
jgi:hypothetical protein